MPVKILEETLHVVDIDMAQRQRRNSCPGLNLFDNPSRPDVEVRGNFRRIDLVVAKIGFVPYFPVKYLIRISGSHFTDPSFIGRQSGFGQRHARAQIFPACAGIYRIPISGLQPGLQPSANRLLNDVIQPPPVVDSLLFFCFCPAALKAQIFYSQRTQIFLILIKIRIIAVQRFTTQKPVGVFYFRGVSWRYRPQPF